MALAKGALDTTACITQSPVVLKLKVLANGALDTTACITQAPVVLKFMALVKGALDTTACITQAPVVLKLMVLAKGLLIPQHVLHRRQLYLNSWSWLRGTWYHSMYYQGASCTETQGLG